MKRLSLVLSVLCLGLVLLGAEAAETPSRSTAFFESYAVAADHVEASKAGAEVLAEGGTAADAAAATMLALGVASPASSGLGGGGFALYYDAKTKALTFFDFRERAPGASTDDMFKDAEARAGEGPLSQPSQIGGLASGVPGEPAGIDALLTKFGKLPRDKVVAPALRLAEKGVTVTDGLIRMSGHFFAQMKTDRTMARWFKQGRTGFQKGDVFKQPELAKSLRAFAKDGAAPFYRGRIARAIVKANKRAGGIMTMEDLADYEVRERQPLDGKYFGYRFVTAPPPSAGGFTMLSSLALMEKWLGPDHRGYGAPFLHAMAESWKGPYLDRSRYFGDPDHVELPLEAMMAPSRIEARARAFHPTLAMPSDDYDQPLRPENPNIVQPEGGGTSHLCVIDAEGNIASVTTTVNLPFGARYTAAGIVMNDQMDDFAREVGKNNAFGLVGGEPNLPGPGRRPVSTMSPTIIFDDAGPVLCIGASGGSRIVTATEQVALYQLIGGLTAEEAIAAPRIHHQAEPNVLRTEEFAPLSPALLDKLRARGHALETIGHVATVQLIRVRRGEDKKLFAASDPRKGGQPAGE